MGYLPANLTDAPWQEKWVACGVGPSEIGCMCGDHGDPSSSTRRASSTRRDEVALVLTVGTEKRARQRAERWIVHKLLWFGVDLIEPDENRLPAQPRRREMRSRLIRQN